MNNFDINAIAETVLGLNVSGKTSNGNQFEDYFEKFTGFLSSQVAIRLLQQSKKSKNVRRYLSQFFYFCNTDTMTNQVFSFIKNYPNTKIRKSLYVAISHCDISLYQLQFINDEILCLEAFARLLDYYLHYDCFTHFDLDYLLKNNKKLINGINWSSFCKESINSKKQEVLRKYALLDQ